MADSIGGVNFFRIDGEVPKHGQGLENITRPYEDGVALRRMGKQAPPVQLTAIVDVLSAAAVRTLLDSTLPNLRGTLVSLVQRGQSLANVAVLDFRMTQVHPAARILGGVNVAYGNSGYWATVEFQVQYAGVPA